MRKALRIVTISAGIVSVVSAVMGRGALSAAREGIFVEISRFWGC